MILALVESTVPLSVSSLGSLLVARLKQEKFDLYKTNLIYLNVKRHYTGITEPSKFMEMLYENKKQIPDRDIIPNLIKKLGGAG